MPPNSTEGWPHIGQNPFRAGSHSTTRALLGIIADSAIVRSSVVLPLPVIPITAA